MIKQFTRIFVLAGLGLALTGAAMAQETPGTSAPRGILNARTHKLEAKPRPAVIPEAVSPVVYTGTLKFVYTIKLVTPVTSSEEVVCSADAIVEDYNTSTDVFYNEYSEFATSIGKVSGSTATCTTEIPYSWALEYASTDMVTYDYDIAILPTSVSSTEVIGATREHTSLLPSTKVPAAGATTTIAISATL